MTPPMIEIIVGAFLRNHAAISSLGARVAGQTPPNPTLPWIRVTQLDMKKVPRSKVQWFMNYLVQFDCYAGAQAVKEDRSQKEATDLGYATVSALHDDFPGVHSGATVTCVEITQVARVPDTDFEPARERYVLTAQIYAHP